MCTRAYVICLYYSALKRNKMTKIVFAICTIIKTNHLIKGRAFAAKDTHGFIALPRLRTEERRQAVFIAHLVLSNIYMVVPQGALLKRRPPLK